MNSERTTGHVWALIQAWMDSIPYPPTQNKLAKRLEISASTLSDWKYRESFPADPERIQALADEIGVPYERVLDAFLKDHRYRMPSPADVANDR